MHLLSRQTTIVANNRVYYNSQPIYPCQYKKENKHLTFSSVFKPINIPAQVSFRLLFPVVAWLCISNEWKSIPEDISVPNRHSFWLNILNRTSYIVYISILYVRAFSFIRETLYSDQLALLVAVSLASFGLSLVSA